jgi:glutamate synthase domain-containing protein 2
MEILAREALMRHKFAMQPPEESDTELDIGGSYQYRVRGEHHILNPSTISKLQHAVRQSSFPTYQEYASLANEQSRDLYTLRGLLDINPAGPPVPIEDVEPAAEIVKRFATGAMSFGSISKEAHETLAIAMNRIGGRSNTGEGGEDEARFQPATPTATGGAAPSSRWPPPASASPPTIWSTPTISRSKFRRAPSPARAANFPATRWMRWWRACAIPSPASL